MLILVGGMGEMSVCVFVCGEGRIVCVRLSLPDAGMGDGYR